MTLRTKNHGPSFAAVALLLLAVPLTGCGDDGDSRPRAGVDSAVADATPDLDVLPDLGITIEDDDGNSAHVGSQLPDDLPEAVFIPTGYTPMTVARQELGGQLSFTIIGSTTDDTATVAAEVEAAYDSTPERLDINGTISLEFTDIDGVDIGYTMNDNADGVAVVTIGVYPQLP